jgi:dihydrofolate reductase
MRELLVTTFLTLDGVMQAPGGPKEDDSGEFAHGGWSVNYWDDLMGEVMNEATSKPFAMVLGRRTYDIRPRSGRMHRKRPAPIRSTRPRSTSCLAVTRR